MIVHCPPWSVHCGRGHHGEDIGSGCDGNCFEHGQLEADARDAIALVGVERALLLAALGGVVIIQW